MVYSMVDTAFTDVGAAVWAGLILDGICPNSSLEELLAEFLKEGKRIYRGGSYIMVTYGAF